MCCPPPFETATALGQREGFIVQDCFAWGRNVFALLHVSLSLSARLRTVRGQEKRAPRRYRVCAPRTWTKALCAGVFFRTSVTRLWEVATLQEACHFFDDWRSGDLSCRHVTGSSSSHNQMCAEPVTLLTVVPRTRTVHAKSFLAPMKESRFLFLCWQTPLLSAL